jgi:hypothetical protein
MERTNRQSNTEAEMSSPNSEQLRRPFTLAGVITAWNMVPRELTILGYTLRLATLVFTVGLEPGHPVVVAGYRESSTEGMVVTRLLLTSPLGAPRA